MMILPAKMGFQNTMELFLLHPEAIFSSDSTKNSLAACPVSTRIWFTFFSSAETMTPTACNKHSSKSENQLTIVAVLDLVGYSQGTTKKLDSRRRKDAHHRCFRVPENAQIPTTTNHDSRGIGELLHSQTPQRCIPRQISE